MFGANLIDRWKLAFGYLKSYGIQGPTPELYFGNSRQISEMMVSLKYSLTCASIINLGQQAGFFNLCMLRAAE